MEDLPDFIFELLTNVVAASHELGLNPVPRVVSLVRRLGWKP
jgi:hypothetical protein